MPGGQDPLKNAGPVPEAGPPLSARSAWPFTSAPVPPAPVGSPGQSRGNPSAEAMGGLPVDVPELSDMWQVMLDGRLLFGRGSGIGISAYTGLGLPDQRTSDIALPSEHGVMALGDFYNARQLVFNLCINARTLAGCDAATAGSSDDPAAASAWDLLRYIAGVWQARTTDVLLEMRMTTGQSYMLLGRPRKFDADTSLLRKGQLAIAAEFIATDPRLYSVVLAQRVINLADADDASLATWCLQMGTPTTGVQRADFTREAPHASSGQIGTSRYHHTPQVPQLDSSAGTPWTEFKHAAETQTGWLLRHEDTTIGSISGVRAVSYPPGWSDLVMANSSDSGPPPTWTPNGSNTGWTPSADFWGLLDMPLAAAIVDPNGVYPYVAAALPAGSILALFIAGTEACRITSDGTTSLILQALRTWKAGQELRIRFFNPNAAAILLASRGYFASASLTLSVMPWTVDWTSGAGGGGWAWTCPLAGSYTLSGTVNGPGSPFLMVNGLPVRYRPTGGALAPVTMNLAVGDHVQLGCTSQRAPSGSYIPQVDGTTPLLRVMYNPSGAPVDPGGGFCAGQAPWGSPVCLIELPLLINGEGVLTNRGNTDSLPIVTFFGPADSPVIWNATTDRELALGISLAAGEQVQVNMRTRQVFRGDAPTTPRYDLLGTSADFWPLIPGENLIRLRQAGRLATTATITWRDAWL